MGAGGVEGGSHGNHLHQRGIEGRGGEQLLDFERGQRAGEGGGLKEEDESPPSHGQDDRSSSGAGRVPGET